jgi:hypothetical protein
MPLHDYIERIKEVEEQDYSFKGEVDPEKMGTRRKRVGSTQRRVSTTDPEAEITVRPGKGTYPAYKAHACVDGRKRVILAITGSRSSIDDMHEVHRLLTTSIFLAGREPKYIVADSHYGGIEALKYYPDQGIETCIRPRMSDSNGGRFKNSEFVRTADGNGLVCPDGQVSYRRIKHRFRYQYRFEKAQCSRCRLRSNCTDRTQGRIVSYYSGAYFATADNLVNSQLGKKLLRQRQTVVEGIWAEAKGWHCLTRSQRRGLSAFNIQLYLTTAAINLKRLMKSVCFHGRASAYSRIPCIVSRTLFLTV